VLGVMRSLGSLGVAVHWVRPHGRPAAATSRYASGATICDPELPDHEYLDRLESLARGFDTPPILIATDDFSAYFIDDHTDLLRAHFIFPEQPRGLPQRLSDKRAMHELCLEHGVPTPRTHFPQSGDEAVELAALLGFPVVLKGIDTSALGERTGARMSIVRSVGELRKAYAELGGGAGGSGLMVQEYIPGPPQSVWMFNGYFDAASECRLGSCGRKLRQAPPYTGATSLGVSLRNQPVYETTVRFMEAVGYRGILDIGYRYDHRDGLYKLLDANPRLGATFRLFVATNGLDVVRALYLDLSGQPVPPASFRDGRRWVLETSDVKSSLAYRADGGLTLRGWLHSLREVEEAAWLARDDPRPAAKAYGAALRKGLSGARGQRILAGVR
jgi:D-aspartate ligase